MVFNQREHAGELREDEDSASFFDQDSEETGEEIEFGGFVDGVCKVIREEAWVAADLAEFEEGIEEDNLELVDAACGDGFANAFVHGGAHGFVEILLRGVQLDKVDELGFGREFLSDLVFGAAEDEGGETFLEGGVAFGVAMVFDGFAEMAIEGVFAAKEAGNEEFEEAPELAEVVFYGGSGEAKAVIGVELAGGLGDFGSGVFDVLRFIEHGDVEGVLAEFSDVSVEKGKGGEDQICMGNRAVVFFSLGSVEDEDAQVWGEFAGFGGPVRNDGSGSNDESGFAFAAARLFFGEDVSEGLEGFSKPHVIG